MQLNTSNHQRVKIRNHRIVFVVDKKRNSPYFIVANKDYSQMWPKTLMDRDSLLIENRKIDD